MNKKKLLSFAIALLLGVSSTFAQKQPVDYVNPLMGTDSKISLSNGNTYPAIALPWGMNFWMPQTGKMGDGWAYTYASDKIRGFKQTHQPSPWINDYGQFSIMPMTKQLKIDQDSRDGKLTVIIDPRTWLMGLFESSDLVSVIRIGPSIAHFTSLRNPKVHSPGQRNGRVSISGR